MKNCRTFSSLPALFQAMATIVAKLPPPMSNLIVQDYGKDPYLILISCLLSLRARDVITYPVSKELFAIAKTPQAMVRMPLKKLEEIIKPIGFYKRKALVLKHVSHELLDRFDGKVPKTEEELLSIKHVGRKTANLVLCMAFDIPAICVDTHVHRLANHMGLVKTKTPEETEQALKKIIPKEGWPATRSLDRTCHDSAENCDVGWCSVNYLLVVWGQHVCKPNSKKCLCFKLESK